MAEKHRKKQQITADLTEVRMQVQNEMSHLRRTLDVKQQILESIKNHPWEWASCAGVFGLLLSRLPARKKRIYIDSSSQKPVKSRADGPLGKLWRGAWKIFKPLIAAYVVKLMADLKRPKASDLEGLNGPKTVCPD